MSHSKRIKAVVLTTLLLFGGAVFAQTAQVKLAAVNEVPPTDSAASALADITVAADKSVSGSITTTGIVGTMAHIHLGAAGANGPVIVSLSKNGDGQWIVPSSAKFTDEQYAAYRTGGLYVNVHSSAHPGGEIRGQLLPQ